MPAPAAGMGAVVRQDRQGEGAVSQGGVEPPWLAHTVDDAYLDGDATLAQLAAAVDRQCRDWGYRNAYSFFDHMLPGLIEADTAT